MITTGNMREYSRRQMPSDQVPFVSLRVLWPRMRERKTEVSGGFRNRGQAIRTGHEVRDLEEHDRRRDNGVERDRRAEVWSVSLPSTVVNSQIRPKMTTQADEKTIDHAGTMRVGCTRSRYVEIPAKPRSRANE
jgi:hypothetical protein